MPGGDDAGIAAEHRAGDAQALELPARVGDGAGPELDRRRLHREDRLSLTHRRDATVRRPWRHVQRDQPPGVPPSRSTASARCPTCRRRTTGTAGTSPSTSGSLPRVAGLRVVELAAGRATAPTCWPRRAASVVGIEPNPEAYEHARLRYPACGVPARHRRDVRGAVRRGRVPPDDRARRRPRRGARAHPRAAAPGRRRVRVDAERADPGAGRARSGRTTRGTCASTGRRSSGRCARQVFPSVELLGVFHARVLRAHAVALRLGWDRVAPGAADHARRSTTASSPRSRAATSRCGRGRSSGRWTCSPCCAARSSVEFPGRPLHHPAAPDENGAGSPLRGPSPHRLARPVGSEQWAPSVRTAPAFRPMALILSDSQIFEPSPAVGRRWGAGKPEEPVTAPGANRRQRPA